MGFRQLLLDQPIATVSFEQQSSAGADDLVLFQRPVEIALGKQHVAGHGVAAGFVPLPDLVLGVPGFEWTTMRI